MPVVLPEPAGWEAWLDPALDGRMVHELLAPLPSDWMSARPASTAVNSARYDAPDCLPVG
jgi:putative SOS response-associated peptidase YedK